MFRSGNQWPATDAVIKLFVTQFSVLKRETCVTVIAVYTVPTVLTIADLVA